MKRDTLCGCGHNLGSHPPDPNRPFAWPCRECECNEYKEVNPVLATPATYRDRADFANPGEADYLEDLNR